MVLSFIVWGAVAAASPQIPAQAELTSAITTRDGEYFKLAFEGCDPVRLRTMVTADVEFYHDKGGFIFHSDDEMAADYKKKCLERKKPGTWRSRRELVKASLRVDPVPGYGAFETGEHVFYERQGDGPEKLVGRARFAIVWRLENGSWKLARILSYEHAAAVSRP